jgi:hypothetical protein
MNQLSNKAVEQMTLGSKLLMAARLGGNSVDKKP